MNSAHLQQQLEESLARHRVPGASVAFLERGELTTAAAGVINVNTGIELTPDTVMHIGSITKVVNATLIMQLVDEGRVALDEPVCHFLPALRLADDEALQQITVKMLLNHTSGIDGDGLEDRGHDEETLANGVARLAGGSQLHSPGAEYSYCNAGSALAGYLAQRVTGTSWYSLIRERIFTPLQMEHAVTLPEEALLHRAAVGHFRTPHDGRLVRVSRAFLPFGFAPAGASLMVSAADLLSFAQAHMNDGVGANGVRILSERSARAMRQVTVDHRDKGYTYTEGMGLGWMVCASGLVHHAGGGPGITATLYAHAERKIAAAVLTNGEYTFSSNLTQELIRSWLKASGIPEPTGAMPIVPLRAAESADARRFTGRYENATTAFSVADAGGALTLSMQAKWRLYEYTLLQPTPPLPLTPLGDDRFLLRAAGVGPYDGSDVYVFRNPDADGRMRHLGNCDRLYRRTHA